MREICDRYDVLLIADEVVTGFGRTGRWLAMRALRRRAGPYHDGQGHLEPVRAAGRGGGVPRVNEPFAAGEAFVHGFTNMGHPVACAVSFAVIDVLREDRLVEHAAEMGEYLPRTRKVPRIRPWPIYEASDSCVSASW